MGKLLSKAPNSANANNVFNVNRDGNVNNNNANNTNAVRPVLLGSSFVLCLYGYGYIEEAKEQ